MRFFRSEEQQQLFDTFADFAREQLNQNVAHRCRNGIFDRQLWQLCATQGVQGLCIPNTYGGMGLDALDTIIALEGLGYGCEDGGLTFALGAQLLSCSIPLWQHGSEAQKENFLRRLCSGELIATNAMTEAQGGSDAFAMHSFATREGDHYQLSGTKSYCANAPVADVCLAYVTTDKAKGFAGGTSVFLLQQDKHAFSVSVSSDKLGLKTCQTGKIVLSGVSAPTTALLGRAGAGGLIFSQSMDWERTGLAALHVGTMTRLLENALAFARERKSGNLPLSKHQAISHVLADISAQLESARLMVYRAASLLNNRKSPNREAAEAKLITSELFKAMTVKLLQIHAQQGYSTDSDIGRAQQDALASTLYSGTSEIQRNIIAAWMGC